MKRFEVEIDDAHRIGGKCDICVTKCVGIGFLPENLCLKDRVFAGDTKRIKIFEIIRAVGCTLVYDPFGVGTHFLDKNNICVLFFKGSDYSVGLIKKVTDIICNQLYIRFCGFGRCIKLKNIFEREKQG